MQKSKSRPMVSNSTSMIVLMIISSTVVGLFIIPALIKAYKKSNKKGNSFSIIEWGSEEFGQIF
jgi:competence protein ComGC